MQLIDMLNSFFSGPAVVGGILLVGVLLSFKTGFVQIRRFFYTFSYAFSSLKKPKGKRDGISPFQAVATALSGTLGTGNIAGVAVAVSVGGAGALFWMWVSAFFGMATKYAEIVLALKYRKKTKDGYHGGAMYYIREATGSKLLATLFAIFCLLASFGIGNMTQSNTAAVSIVSVFGFGDFQIKIIFFILSVLLCVIMLGGINRIAKITSVITPFMAGFYIICCFVVIFSDLKSVLPAFAEIFKSAFCFESVAGGTSGYMILKAMKVGFARGVFTNEAGLGSAPIAHAAAENKLPALQGLWGVFEVFLDTIFMCTLTGLVLLISKVAPSADMTIKAFSKCLGDFAGVFVGISTLLFAISTIIGWSYYGEVAVRYLFKRNRAVLIYKLCFSVAVYVGAVSSISFVWGISDILNGFMMLPNLAAIVLLSGVVKSETARLDKHIMEEKAHVNKKRLN